MCMEMEGKGLGRRKSITWVIDYKRIGDRKGILERESEESGGDNGTGMGDRQKKVWERLGEKAMAI